MARTADHDARRRQIADAVRALVSEGGLDSATVAKVAEQAGISVGLVQHYFPTKDNLVLFTYEQVLADVNARVETRIADGEAAQQSIRTVVFASLSELLPTDRRRRAEYRIAQAFAARALHSQQLAGVAATTWAGVLDRLAATVGNGKHCGEVRPDLDAELAAVRILAVTDGLAAQLYRRPDAELGRHTMTGAAEAVLRSTLGEVFTGRCRHYDQDTEDR